MMNGKHGLTPSQLSLIQVGLGFVGVSLVLLVIPRTFRRTARRFTVGILSEVAGIVATGLITGGVASRAGHDF